MATKKMENIMTGTVKVVPLKDLAPDPNQPRQDFREKELNQLMDSISDKGILNPIVVEPKENGKYLIVDGERRYRASSKLKLKKVPVSILNRKLSITERDVARFHLQENHKQWSFFEKAEAMLRLQKSLGIASNAELARALGVSFSTAKHYLATLSFPKRERKLAMEWNVPFSAVVVLSYLKSMMPMSISNSYPDFLEICLKKFKSGVVKNDREFRVLNRLIKAGEYKIVKKFLSDPKYTTTQAELESNYMNDRHVDSVVNRANALYRDITIMQQNDLELDEVGVLTLQKLKGVLENY